MKKLQNIIKKNELWSRLPSIVNKFKRTFKQRNGITDLMVQIRSFLKETLLNLAKLLMIYLIYLFIIKKNYITLIKWCFYFVLRTWKNVYNCKKRKNEKRKMNCEPTKKFFDLVNGKRDYNFLSRFFQKDANKYDALKFYILIVHRVDQNYHWGLFPYPAFEEFQEGCLGRMSIGTSDDDKRASVEHFVINHYLKEPYSNKNHIIQLRSTSQRNTQKTLGIFLKSGEQRTEDLNKLSKFFEIFVSNNNKLYQLSDQKLTPC